MDSDIDIRLLYSAEALEAWSNARKLLPSRS